MFDLFKKKEQPVKSQELTVATQSVLEAVANTKNYPKEVLEIHHEFQIASETLLMTAKSIIDEASTKDVQKVNRLEKLGFKQAGQVTEIKPLMQQAELSKEQIELVKYYQREYPLNKFITEEQVKAICHKWNLVCGDVGRYKGFVPEKNLRDIEKFNLKNNEKGGHIFISKEGENIFLSDDDLTAYGKDFFKRNPTNGMYITGRDGEDIYGGNKFLTEKCHARFSHTRYLFVNRAIECVLQICAPVKDMDISGLELKDGYKLIKHVPDPVVLQPVKGGYLILTAWGDEASDENVVNQKMN